MTFVSRCDVVQACHTVAFTELSPLTEFSLLSDDPVLISAWEPP